MSPACGRRGGVPVRVLFLASTLKRGGAERIIIETAAGLQDRHGFRCRMLCLREGGKLGEELSDRGVETDSGFIRGRVDPSGFMRLRRVIKSEGPDVLYMLDHRNAVFYGVPASLAAGVRSRVMAVHTMGLHGGGRSVPRSVKMFLPWIDSVVTVARSQQEYLERVEGLPRDKMAYVPNGVDVNRFRPAADEAERKEARRSLGLPERGAVVATLSVLRPEKDHVTFLKAAAAVSKERPEVTFAVLGDGPEREKLENVAKSLGIEGRVRFGGWIADTAMALRAVDIVVFSSKPVVETAPLAGLEAMATGVPVVASDVGALREQIEDGRTGYLVPAGDSGSLAARICALLGDEPLRAEMARRSREIVEIKFRLDTSVAATAALLGGLAGARGAAI